MKGLMWWLVMGLAGWAWSAAGCPTSCTCKWKGGKQTVECINKSLITIPQSIDQGTQVLEFSGNNLDRLLKERFQREGLINLQKIFLPRCRIRTIEDRAFVGLSNLVELDLSDNILTSVPTETFRDYMALMKLNLNGNPIRELKTGAFQPLSYLTSLDVSMCGIDTIEDGAFNGLNNLEWLKLDNNKISYIQGSNVLPENLHGVALHHNPWQCDCKLVDVRSWLQSYSVPQTVEPACGKPLRMHGTLLKDLKEEDLACVPDVSPTALYLEIGEGRNVSLLCRVSAVPEAKVSWWFQGNTLQNDSTVAPGLHLYYFVEEGTIEKTSELIILNTNADDNGTFACVAENPAGKSLSNYTIRIILKEEPVINLTVFPYEYMLILSVALSVLVLLSIICFALCLVQCKRQARRKRKKERKQGHDKAPLAREETIVVPTRVALPKANGIVLADQEVAVYSTEQVTPCMFPAPQAPPTPFQDKNPDLISDARPEPWSPRAHLTADVHLSPSKFIGPDGYPLDYGLPKLPYPAAPAAAAFYRTLPHKGRAGSARFSREAELVPGPCRPQPYEHLARYTAEGYPGPTLYPVDPFLSPPAPYKGHWPPVTQSVGAQTATKPLEEPPALPESPDEGYEGETSEPGGDM